jgi:hypothetical protein
LTLEAAFEQKKEVDPLGPAAIADANAAADPGDIFAPMHPATLDGVLNLGGCL